ncbi:50S ribosomal protein L29 [Candidatus Woesearchaeota archaeon]|nr:50S ribosomal protein L29 [Candidatus Woesearchaeota archaeon]
MKFKEMAQMGADERKRKKKELELELIKLNTQVATGTPPKNAGTVSRIKKDIARLMLIERLAEVKAEATKISTPKRAVQKEAKK